MSLTITTLLTLVAMASGVYQTSPRTAYLKAIDVWLLVCFLFSFSVLVLYSVFVYVTIMKATKNVRGIAGLKDISLLNTIILQESSKSEGYVTSINHKSKVLLPILFGLFCIVFFAVVHMGGAADMDATNEYTVEHVKLVEVKAY